MSEYLYNISERTIYDETIYDETSNLVSIVSRDFWESNHCLDDRGIRDRNLLENLESIGLFECMESIFEIYSDEDIESIRFMLEAFGLVSDPEFDEFCNEHPL